jgi:ABC-type dipeptide/oligopeptide/nickel transport system permease component
MIKIIIIIIIIIITITFFNFANAQALGNLYDEEVEEELNTKETINQNIYDFNENLGDMFEATTGLVINIKAQKERERQAKYFKKNTKVFFERWENMTGTEKDLYVKNKQEKKITAHNELMKEHNIKWEKNEIIRKARGEAIPRFTNDVYTETIKPIINVFGFFMFTSILINLIGIAFGSLAGREKETQTEYKTNNKSFENYKTAESNRQKKNQEKYEK